MNASLLRSGLPPTPAVPPIAAAGSNAGTPTAPDRVPARTATARPFADMLRHHRADSLPAPAPSAGTASSADDAGNESTEAADASTDRPGTPTKTRPRTGTPSRSPAAADKSIRDSSGLAETRTLDERSAEPASERPLPVAESGVHRPLPTVEDKTARASLAATVNGEDGDAAASSAVDGGAGTDASSRRPGRSVADDARADRRSPSARSADAELASNASPTTLATADAPRLHDAGSMRPSFDVALQGAAPAPGTSMPAVSGEATRADAATPAFTVPTPVDSPEFAGALGVQVSLLARDGVQQAELHLNPAEMGPVSIRIKLDGSDAQVQFGADLAETRQAIERGLPELASALRDAGFTLSGGGVSQHAGQRHGDGTGNGDRDPRGSPDAGPMHGREAPGSGADGTRAIRRVAAGGVDLYA